MLPDGGHSEDKTVTKAAKWQISMIFIGKSLLLLDKIFKFVARITS